MTKKLLNLCRTYINHTTYDESYIIARDAVIDAMREAGIEYIDCEHAAEIAYSLVMLDDVNVRMEVTK